jgi:hypothetical protein
MASGPLAWDGVAVGWKGPKRVRWAACKTFVWCELRPKMGLLGELCGARGKAAAGAVGG